VGQTYLETANGRVELGANQVGFAPAAGVVAPSRLPVVPGFMGATPPLREGARGNQSGSAGNSAGTGGGSGGTSGSTAVTTAAPVDGSTSSATSSTGSDGSNLASGVVSVPPVTVLPPTTAGVFNPLNPGSAGTPAPNGTAVAGGGMGIAGPSNGAGIIGDPNNSLSVTVDSAGSPVSVTGGDFSYSRNGAPAIMLGSTTVGGETVKWGIYGGGTMVDSGVTSSGTPFFWMTSTSASTTGSLMTAMPSAGATLSFSSMAGHTPPITESGAMGGSVSASVVLANLSGVISVSSYSLNVVDAQSRTWNASLTAPQTLLAFQSGAVQNLSGSCSGCAQSLVTGNVQGVPIGNPLPVGMISSYSMTAGSSAVVGSALSR